MTSGIEPFYRGWRLANEALVGTLRDLAVDQLRLPVGSPSWPVWASV